jgi:hypothetical protein
VSAVPFRVEVAERLSMSSMRTRGCLADFARALALRSLPDASFGAGGNRVSRHSSSTDGVVSSDVAHNQPKERRECPWPPAGSGAGQLQDGVVDPPQAASGDGAPRAVSLLKRWMLGTHQGAIGHQHLDDYLNEFVFRFNPRKSASRGKLFFWLAQQAVQNAPTTYERLVRPQYVE